MSENQYKKAIKVYREGKVVFKEFLNAKIIGSVGQYEVILNSEGDQCLCAFKSLYGVDAGDCYHIIAFKYKVMKYLDDTYKGDKRSA